MKFTLIKRGGIFFCGIILASSIFINNVFADGGLVGRGILESPELTAVFIDDLAEYKKPIIQGTAGQEVARVRIIIDSQLINEVGVDNGTFSYQSIWPLRLGEHFVYTVAIAADGRESWASNVINFFIIEPSEDGTGLMPRISATSTKAYVGVTEEAKSKVINLRASTSLFAKYFTERGTSTTGRIVDGTSVVFAVIVLALLFWIYKRNKNKDDDIDDDYNDQDNESSFYQEPLFKEDSEDKKDNEVDKDDNLI